jgi:hypothetical protein
MQVTSCEVHIRCTPFAAQRTVGVRAGSPIRLRAFHAVPLHNQMHYTSAAVGDVSPGVRVGDPNDERHIATRRMGLKQTPCREGFQPSWRNQKSVESNFLDELTRNVCQKFLPRENVGHE